MDLTRIPGLKGMPAVPPPHGITETAKSPLPSSTSPSSPSSSPASPPSSSSSSPGAMATSYHNDIQEERANSMMMGDVVSSTSASLAPPSSHSDPPFSSSDPLLCLSPPVSTDGQKERETEIYDPFHPTEGEREEGAAEEEEREKYDPFDPTGSPPSEREEEERKTGGGRERGNSVSSTGSDARGKRRKAETGRTGGEEKDNAPPDSTDALSVPPLSPRSLPLPLRRRLDRTKELRVKVRDRREKGNHSDHSEIEEGEIVGATDRDGGKTEQRCQEGVLPLVLPISSGSPFLHRGAKPERILRVLEGDSFVSVRAEGDWVGLVMPGREDGEPMEEEEVVVVGAGDLRRKLVSRRKARYRSSFPSSLSPQHLPPSPPTVPLPPSPLTAEKDKSRKSSKSSKERERRKRKECKVGEEEEERRRRKKRKEKEDGGGEKSGERKERHRERGRRSEKEKKTKVEERGRSNRSDSRKRKKRQRSTPESSARPRSQNSSVQQAHGGRSWSNTSEDRHRVRDGDRDRENNRDRYRDGERDGDRDKDRKKDDTRRRERDGYSSRIKRERDSVRESTSRERGSSKRSKGSIERRHRERDRHQDRERHRERHQDRERDRERRRDGRPVVPPSIQDLNGSDLFAIKRTITVTTTTTTTLPGSPPLPPSSPRSPSQGSEKPYKRKKKSRRRSDEELEDSMGRRGSRSLSPPSHYHGYDSDHFSDKLEIDMHSLDGEALDSDYPSIEDSPPPPQPLEPTAPSTKSKTATKPGRHHFKKKSRTGKKAGQSESSSSSLVRPKGKGLSTSSLSPTQATSGMASTPAILPSAKRGRKIGKEKERGEKGGKKGSGRSKKLSGGGRKAKLQSKVSVLVREGVSSTTGGPVGSGKLGMELLGAGGSVGGSGMPVVGGSIAVVFRRDNESRSPFLKPCSEPLLLSGRNKDLGKVGKRSSLAAPPSSSLANPTVAALKSKKAKPSSTTSTSSSASSPSSSLATKRRRRLAKKTRGEKGLAAGLTDVDGAMANCISEGGSWGGPSSDIQSGVGTKPSSPHSGPAGPTPSSSSSSSSSSSTSVLPPSSSPPHTPPPSLTTLRDARESSPDSQTVDSSCKTPEPSFPPEDCPAQTQSTPNLPPSSPTSLPSSQGEGLSQYGPSSMKPEEEGSKSLASPPCSSSSGSALASLSLPPTSTDPSSSSSSSVSSSSANKLPPPPPPPPPAAAAPTLPWSLQTGVDCTAGGVLALTALLFKMEEANIASRAKAQEFIHATSQILSQTNQNHSSQHAPSSSSSSQVPPPPGPTPAQFILHSSLPLVGCTKTPPSHLHPGMSMGGGCAQTPPPPMPSGFSGGSGGSSDIGWDNESKDPDKYLKKLHTQERAVEEVKLAIKPYYQRKDINKDDYKDILRKAVHKICHSRTGEINPVKVSNLVKLYVQRYKYFRKHGRKMDEEEREDREMDSSY